MQFSPLDMLPDELQDAIRTAELQDGKQYGALFDDGRECFVTVVFYPRRQWLITYRDTNEQFLLTDEIAVRLNRLVL